MANVLNIRILDKFQIVYQALKQLTEENGINLYVSAFKYIEEHPDIKQRIKEIKEQNNARTKQS